MGTQVEGGHIPLANCWAKWAINGTRIQPLSHLPNCLLPNASFTAMPSPSSLRHVTMGSGLPRALDFCSKES